MEAALTFGSLGDILALCQVAVQLSRALGGGCQALGVRAAIMMQVIATYQEREPYVYLSQLDNVTKDAVRDCTDLVEEALRHFQSKYGSSLQQGGSGNKLRDARKKIEWSLREKERLRELRGKLSRNTQRLLLLCALTAQKSARVDNATMIMRIDHVRQLVEAQEGCHEEMLRLLQEQEKLSTTQTEQLENVNKQLVTQSHDIHGAVTIAKQSFMAIVEIKDALTMVASNLSELRTFVFRFLDPTKELPVTIEDALGRRLPIPPEWLDCMQWETFYSLLQDQFRGQKGYLMVCQRQFVLEEDITGKDIAQTQPLGVCLRRGMKISMGMIFTVDLLSGMCPRCQTMNEAPEGLTTIQWKSGCNLRFRLTEVTSATEGTAAPVVQVISAESSEAKPSDFVFVWLHRSSQVGQRGPTEPASTSRLPVPESQQASYALESGSESHSVGPGSNSRFPVLDEAPAIESRDHPRHTNYRLSTGYSEMYRTGRASGYYADVSRSNRNRREVVVIRHHRGGEAARSQLRSSDYNSCYSPWG